MPEDVLYAITGLVGVVVGWNCFQRIYRKGKSRKQRRAERWEAQGGVAQGALSDVKLLRAGDTALDSDELREDLFRALYRYDVNGTTYTAACRFLSGYPRRITVYYNPENPKEYIVANEISEVARRNRGCLLSILLTSLAIGLCGNLLRRLFMG